jgi:hypothetical protein
MTDSNPIAEPNDAELNDAELNDAELNDVDPKGFDVVKKEFMQRIAGNWSEYS